MKHILFPLISILSISLSAQFEIYTIDLTTNDLVYDSNTKKIYVSIPSSNGNNGNSIGVINPFTRELENTVFIGSEPTVLAISDNGQYIYSGFDQTSTVRRFDVATQTAGLEFSLGGDDFLGPYYVEDLEVMPGSPTTIAISRKHKDISPIHAGIAIYDNDVLRPTVTPSHTGGNQIEFKNSSTMFGYNNESTGFYLYRYAINAGGITEVFNAGGFPGGFNFFLEFSYHNNRLYFTNGRVVNVENTPFVAGQFANAVGPVVYDSHKDYVIYATHNSSGEIRFKRFDPTTYLIQDDIVINEAFGNAKKIITCGYGCYAFNSIDNKVVIINDGTMGINDLENKTLKIYPNPTSEYLHIQGIGNNFEQVEIYTLTGQLVRKIENLTSKINVQTLAKGTYILKMVNAGKVHQVKFIKQ
jgi:hypothetical protein